MTNLKMIEIVEKNAKCPPKVFELMAHVINAQAIWNSRILDNEESLHPWQTPILPLFKLEAKNHATSATILEKIPLDQWVKYKNSKGETFENKVGDILFHVVNHGTHHKGQMITLLKSAGIKTPILDYIFLDRNKEL